MLLACLKGASAHDEAINHAVTASVSFGKLFMSLTAKQSGVTEHRSYRRFAALTFSNHHHLKGNTRRERDTLSQTLIRIFSDLRGTSWTHTHRNIDSSSADGVRILKGRDPGS